MAQMVDRRGADLQEEDGITRQLGVCIHINGIVQGVGFRPFVYSLAGRLSLTGWVCNTAAGVDIEVDGSKDQLEDFIQALEAEAPPLAQIDEVIVTWNDAQGFTGFDIVHSQDDPGAFQPISPDVSVCPDCLEELFDPQDRRFRYPFINCTNCGPRFTIIQGIPYDRPNTTMAAFPLCAACETEYQDPGDRRFHAQPVACPECGPQVWLEVVGETPSAPPEREDAIQTARQILKEGKILAVKGLGGFHLACDAAKPQAVAELRRRKLRVDKPFALMVADSTAAAAVCELNTGERALLENRQRPIVVLARKSKTAIAEGVAPGQSTLGVMLPYTPLHYLLLEPQDGFPPALVMTSGNLSEEPLAIRNDEARRRLSPLADAFLFHDREIYIRCDDSVIRQIPSGNEEGGAYPLRRSRGYAPDPLRLIWEMPPILAAGAELKNTFCLTQDRYAFLSHHIGDLENYETLAAFEMGIKHFETLFRITPERIAYDLHPDYLATRYAIQRAQEENLPAVGVQHHHAHIAACMAENGHPPGEPVIGLAYDGSGYGSDGTIWGGEVLLATYRSFRRAYHLKPVRLPGGDAAIKQPWRMALAWLHQAGLAWDQTIEGVEPEAVQIIKHQIVGGTNAPYTSSIGRLFDAAAALAGLRQTVNYEAQAAIEFEALIDPLEDGGYPFEIGGGILDPSETIRAILDDVRLKTPIPSIAARFHNTVAQMSLAVCRQIRGETGLNTVALSGGVWQNKYLLEKTIRDLDVEGFTIYLHRQVPANDGGLALGQAVIAYHTTH